MTLLPEREEHDKNVCPDPGDLFVYQTDNKVVTRIVAVFESKPDDSLHEALTDASLDLLKIVLTKNMYELLKSALTDNG